MQRVFCLWSAAGTGSLGTASLVSQEIAGGRRNRFNVGCRDFWASLTARSGRKGDLRYLLTAQPGAA